MTMIDTSKPVHRQSIHHIDAIDGFRVPVRTSGPDSGHVVVMFDGAPHTTDAYDIVRERLHVAMFRTVVFPVHQGLNAKAIIGILDRLKVSGALLVGDGSGGDLAWNLAAAQRERFTGLVVIDRGHPRAPDEGGVIQDKHCPAVEVGTTALVSTHTAHAVARASRRYVQGEFRLVELAGPRTSRHFISQLTAEIVVRALSR
jgi:pimeloyl-ACP methyl ester carboxylesterase